MKTSKSINWELHDYIVDYLESNACSDAFSVLESAIETKAREMIIRGEDKFAESHGIMGKIVNWLLKNKLPENCDRNSKLFKNIAIWCVNSGFSSSFIDKIDIIITNNCVGRKRGEIKGWVKWVKRGKRKEVNINEIKDVVIHARRQGA